MEDKDDANLRIPARAVPCLLYLKFDKWKYIPIFQGTFTVFETT